MDFTSQIACLNSRWSGSWSQQENPLPGINCGRAIDLLDNTLAVPCPSERATYFADQEELISVVKVRLIGFSHTYSSDMALILEGPGGIKTTLIANCGAPGPFLIDGDFIFADDGEIAPALMTWNGAEWIYNTVRLTPGRYRPTSYDRRDWGMSYPSLPVAPGWLWPSGLPAECPVLPEFPGAAIPFSSFNGRKANACWKLWGLDAVQADKGYIDDWEVLVNGDATGV